MKESAYKGTFTTLFYFAALYNRFPHDKAHIKINNTVDIEVLNRPSGHWQTVQTQARPHPQYSAC